MSGVTSLFKSAPKSTAPQINFAQTFSDNFQGISTGAFDFGRNPESEREVGINGVELNRTNDTMGQFSTINSLLGANRTNFGGLIDRIRGLSPQIGALQGQAAGQLDASALLQQQLQGTIPGLNGIFNAAGDIRNRFGALGRELAAVQSGIEPGFGRLTAAQVQEVRNQQAAQAGTLRETFAQRGLGGSSFAAQEQQRNALDFSQREEMVRGEAFTRELAATRDIAALRGQILSGEVGTVQEQRAVIAETRNVINSVGNLLSLDAQTLNQQANLVGMQLGLTEAESRVFANQLASIQTLLQSTNAQLTQELNELGIAGNLVSSATNAATQVAIQQAQAIASTQAANAYARIAQQGQQLDFLGNIVAAGIGFGSGLGGGSKSTGSVSMQKPAGSFPNG